MKSLMAPHVSMVVSSTESSMAKSDRRASKPLMEKRRRERINRSLNELKSILLDALRKDSTCHSKLEKADILEMTVRYLRSIQRRPLAPTTTLLPTIINNYSAEFSECEAELRKFLQKSMPAEDDVNPRLVPRVRTNPCSTLRQTTQSQAAMNTVPTLLVDSTFPVTVPVSPTSTSKDGQYLRAHSSGMHSGTCSHSDMTFSPIPLKANYHTPPGHLFTEPRNESYASFVSPSRFPDYLPMEGYSPPCDDRPRHFRYTSSRPADAITCGGPDILNAHKQVQDLPSDSLAEFAIKTEPASPAREAHVWRPW